MNEPGRARWVRSHDGGCCAAGAGIAAGTALAGGPLNGFVALAEGAPRQRPDRRALGPVPDERDGQVRLHLPEGFRYRSFHDTEAPVTLDDGTALPGRHDGMAAFDGRHGNIVLVRNHEVNGPVPAAFGPGTPYDTRTGGGTTTTVVTRYGEVVNAFTSLNGTQMNCSGGRMPWGSWVTCEETVNGPDVGADFTGALNVDLTKPHGWIFEVPASADQAQGQSTREPIRKAGRFAHEAVAYDPHQNHLYLTEDNFGFPSGFYRYTPPTNAMRAGRLEDGGTLQMLAVRDVPNADLAASQPRHAVYRVRWVDIPEPDPEYPYTPGEPAPTTNNDAIQYVGLQGLDAGRGRVLPPRGLRLRPRRRLLLLDAGRRSAGARRQRHRRRVGQRDRADLGVPHAARTSCASCTSRRGPRRWTSRTTSRPASAARSCCARTTSTTTTCAA